MFMTQSVYDNSIASIDDFISEHFGSSLEAVLFLVGCGFSSKFSS